MQIVYHLGAHCTDEERLLRALLKNRGTLEARGISVPASRQYRTLLPKVAKSLRGGYAGADAQQVILDAVMETETAQRLVFSHDGLICFPVNVVADGVFYATAPMRIASYANLFPEAETEFHLALRNPATLVPALIERAADRSYAEVMGHADPMALRWAPAIERVLDQRPDLHLTLWCNEDTPLLWPEILRGLAGLGSDAVLEGDFDLLATIMTEDGLSELKAHLDAHPPETVAERREITADFLDRFARPEEIEVEIALPGWDAALVAAMTAAYEEDCAEIASMPGVTFLQP
ncbi:hypothetical protein [Defluviimonas salinarum]|uniref:Uncharacterized protein n=1 Tax=Defluviimonas salinarum TaxID=2992147 RepID=A0ABT3J0J6_9RHOB|nr:hypothetical protein [Defluviimonas salinarum]MCW3781217.1 hypothetical protein [Defluviimonas salinarum]